jgi:hypothetical protein
MSARFAARFAVLALALVAIVSAPLPAQSAAAVKKPSPYAAGADGASAPVAFIEDLEGGAKINWQEGRLSVSGVGTPGDRGPVSYRHKLAERSAIADAYHRLSSSLELVRVDTNTHLKDLAIIDDALRVRLNDYVKGAQVLETNFWPDGSAEVVLSVALRGDRSLTALAAGENAKATAPDMDATGTPDPKPTPARKGAKQIVSSPVPIHAGYSSIIVDAHGLGALPALLPNLRDNSGKVIDLGLEGARVSIKYVKEGADLEPSAGLNPLTVRAVRTQGVLKADFVLSPDASDSLKEAIKDKKVAAGMPLVVKL